MGERAPEPAAPVREAWGRGWWALGALFLALLAGVLAGPLDLDPAEASHLALATSLARDGDRAWEADDRAAWPEVVGVESPPTPHRRGATIASPLAPALLAAPGAVLGPRAALVWQLLLLGAGVFVATVALARRVGPVAPWLGLVLLGGSVAWAYGLRLWPETGSLALALAAFGLAHGAGLPRRQELPDVYGGEDEEAGWRTLLRWLAVGGLLGALASTWLPLAWLVLPAAAAVPRERRRSAWVALFVGVVLVGLPLLALEGAEVVLPATHGAGVADLVDGWRFAPGLWIWNAVYLAAGRQVGTLLYLAPLVLLAGLTVRGEGRGLLWAAATLVVATGLWLWPFSWAGGAPTLGPRALLPVYGALWLVAARRPTLPGLLAPVAWTGLFLWPLVTAPFAAASGDPGSPSPFAAYLPPWPPVETTQTALLPAPLEVPGGQAWVVTPHGWLSRGEPSTQGDETLELLVASRSPLGTVVVVAPELADVELEVRGATLEDLMFRPDGATEFRLDPGPARVRHPTPARAEPTFFYRLALEWDEAAYRPFAVRLRLLPGLPP